MLVMRLNKFVAENTGLSRRQADELILQGKVAVAASGQPKAAVLGQQLDDGERVFVRGRELKTRLQHSTILLNKPVGYLSSRRSQGGDPTVYDLLPPPLKDLKTAGRLDKDSSGLMILSSDGDLIQQLTHPKYQKVKVYEIELNKPLEPLHQQMIADLGIDLPDGKSRLGLEKSGEGRRWRVTMHEGRNRQIRRTFAALGYSVKRLHRTQLGPYSLGDLKAGKFRKIDVE
jgi:23S rRNA pseudouridine2605 synthase